MSKLVKLKKIGVSETPQVETAPSLGHVPNKIWDYFDNSYNDYSPSVGYWVILEIEEEPKVGKSLSGLRFVRNGNSVLGVFKTSKIVKIFDGGFETKNSVYSIENCSKEETEKYKFDKV